MFAKGTFHQFLNLLIIYLKYSIKIYLSISIYISSIIVDIQNESNILIFFIKPSTFMAAKLYQILISALPEVKSFHDLAIR